ncbi:GNAT family N-acetyltransferase [Clostridium sp. CS001]|nr:GNAT family N-acetyltransferase [Clostridium sp. CS001]MCB2290896.1 GNAT family N-acetyltransferase [Clostridium sp. CS001]
MLHSIYRKSEVYTKSNSNLDLYVCNYRGIPIGNCELMLNSDIAKIEDFDILNDYQRKGFGTSVVKYLLEEAKENSVEFVYLITDSVDTAKEMYKKCGFKKAGEKTELFFDLG